MPWLKVNLRHFPPQHIAAQRQRFHGVFRSGQYHLQGLKGGQDLPDLPPDDLQQQEGVGHNAVVQCSLYRPVGRGD